MGVLADCEMMYLFIMTLSLVPETSCQPSNSLGRFKGTSDDWSETRISLEQDLESVSEKPVLKQKMMPHSILSESGIVMQILNRDFQPALHLRTDIPEITKDQTLLQSEDPTRVSKVESSPALRTLDSLEVTSLMVDEKAIFPKGRDVIRTDISTTDLLIYILEIISKDYNVILLHDNHPDTRSDINSLLDDERNFKLMIVNISDPQLSHELWMGDYNDGLDVHVLFFREVVTVKAFADSMPALLWAPDHLLLINADEAEDATVLLGHDIFSHSPYFTLLQLDQRIQSRSVYEILIYEAFRKGNKVTRRGFVGSPKAPLTFDALFPDRFESFHGYYFHLSSWVDDFPYMVQGKTLEDTYGMCIFMLDDIAERLNFTYKVYELPEDHLWGDLYNGTWRGMVGEVWRGERDFCINVMSLVEDRFHAVDFSVPYFLDSDSFVTKNPLPPPRWSSIIFPFSWVTWIALCMALLCLPVIFICLNKFKGVGKRDPTSMFMDVTKALLRQDSPPITPHLSIRVFIGNWWLMAMILSISYTGNLIAFITIPAKAQKMRTLQEVAESDLTPVMIDYGNFMHSVMQKSGDKTLMILGEKLQFLPNDDYQAGFDMVEEGKAAFLEGTEYFRYMVILFKAWNTYFLEEVFFPSYVGWIYPKKTAWKHKFDKYLQRFVEAGLPTYWRNKLAYDFRREMNLTRVNSENTSRPLNLVDLQGVFIVYGLCLALSIVVGLVEILACGKC